MLRWSSGLTGRRIALGSRCCNDGREGETANACNEYSENNESRGYEPKRIQVNGFVAVQLVVVAFRLVIRWVDTVNLGQEEESECIETERLTTHQNTASDEPAEKEAVDKRLIFAMSGLNVSL